MTTVLTAPPALRLRFHHLGVAVPSLPEAIASYEAIFGYRVRCAPVQDPIQRVDVCFLEAAGDGPVLELVAPVGNDSPATRMLAHGLGAYHVCYETDDLDEAVATCRAQGCIPAGAPVAAAAFNGRRIAWLFTPTKQLLELVQA